MLGSLEVLNSCRYAVMRNGGDAKNLEFAGVAV
jgi:hypothetical protein